MNAHIPNAYIVNAHMPVSGFITNYTHPLLGINSNKLNIANSNRPVSEFITNYTRSLLGIISFVGSMNAD